jgi:competence protein ComEC
MLSRLPVVAWFLVAVFGAGIGVSASSSLPVVVAVGCAVLIGGIVAATTGGHPASRGLGVCAVVGATALLAGALERWQHDRVADRLPDDAGLAVVEGVIVDDQPADEGRRWVVRLDAAAKDHAVSSAEADSSPPSPLIRRATIAVSVCAPGLIAHPDVVAGAGDRVRVRGRLRRPEPALSPGTFDAESLALSRSIHATMTIADDADVAVVARGQAPFLVELRRRLRERLLAQLSPRLAGLLLALLIGDTSLFEEEQDIAYRHVGAGHLLAVSGLQVTLLAVVLRRLAAGLWVIPTRGRGRWGQRGAAALALVGVWLFVGLCGLPPSAVRAGVMATAVIAGAVAGRRVVLVDAVAAAGVLTVLASPTSVHDAGFLLSYAAVLALAATSVESTASSAAGGSWVAQLRTTVRAAMPGLVASLTAGCATLPLSAWLFGQVAPAGLVANVVLVPVASVLQLPALVGGVVGAALHLDGVSWCGGQAALLLEALVFGLRDILPGVEAIEPPSAVGAALLTLAALGIGAMIMAGRRGFALVVTGIVLAGWYVARLETRALRVTFLPVGQGDGVVVEFPDGPVMVIDAGGRVPLDPTMSEAGRAEVLMEPGRRVVVPFLQRRGIERVDVMVVSHPHPDHAGGLAAVATAMPVGSLWLAADVEHPGRLLQPLIDTIGRDRVVSTPELLGRHEMGGAVVEVLGPAPSERTPTYPELHANDNSVVLRICFEGACVLLPGDLEALGEELLLESVPRDALHATVVKAGHHGSRTSSSPAFVAATGARHVVLCTGRHNTFGFPHPDVVSRWQASGAAVWDTAVHGELRFEVRDGDVVVSTYRSGEE